MKIMKQDICRRRVNFAVAMETEAEPVAKQYPGDVSGGSEGADDDIGTDSGGEDRTCLGVRRRCLTQSAQCSRALSDHRRYCRDSTRLLHCSAVEWSVSVSILHRFCLFIAIIVKNVIYSFIRWLVSREAY